MAWQDDIINNFLTEKPVPDTSPDTFPARLEAVLAKRVPLDPHTRVTYNGEDFCVEDVPSILARALWGYGHDPADVRLREHLTRPDDMPWAYTPSTCLVAGAGPTGVWRDENHLCCPGCGLDFT